MITARNGQGDHIMVMDAGESEVGYCPCCGKEMIPKHGNGGRRPHWAHKHAERCDEWLETQTEWHYRWRERFLKIDGEHKVIIEDTLAKDGERHFYDARIDDRLSLILRRAQLPEEYQKKREAFFGEMVWVVGAGASALRRFKQQLEDGIITEIRNFKNCYLVRTHEQCFFAKWSNSSMPVAFDFGEVSEGKVQDLWVLLPNILPNNKRRYLIRFTEEVFLQRLSEQGCIFLKPLTEICVALNTELERQNNEYREMQIRNREKREVEIEQPSECDDRQPIFNPDMNSVDCAKKEETIKEEPEAAKKPIAEADLNIYAGNKGLAEYWKNK